VEQPLELHDGPGGARRGTEGAEVVRVKPGVIVENFRKRADKLTDERWAELDALGMRWSVGTARRSTS
jgi:hypothetical protein